MKSAKLNSPAKLNLGLHVVGRRPNGYHELESVFWPITLCDSISLQESKSNQVVANWDPSAPFSTTRLPQNQDNLVFRVLEAATQRGTPQFKVEIKKRIPVGGGLGGGSSNAGTVLHFLCENFPSLRPEANDIALSCGADTPFFLNPTPTWVTGIGERLSGLPSTAWHPTYFLVVCFPKPTATPDIFQALRTSSRSFSARWAQDISSFALDRWIRTAQNDLEPFAVQQYPLIGEVLARLRQTTAEYAALSGSGSTCFAAFSRRNACATAAKELEEFFRQVGCRSVEAATFNS